MNDVIKKLSMNKLWISLLSLALIVTIGLWVKNQIEIDSCLDLGGRWDYKNNECEKHRGNLQR